MLNNVRDCLVQMGELIDEEYEEAEVGELRSALDEARHVVTEDWTA